VSTLSHRIQRRIVRLSRFAIASGERYRAGEHFLGQLDSWALAGSGHLQLPHGNGGSRSVPGDPPGPLSGPDSRQSRASGGVTSSPSCTTNRALRAPPPRVLGALGARPPRLVPWPSGDRWSSRGVRRKAHRVPVRHTERGQGHRFRQTCRLPVGRCAADTGSSLDREGASQPRCGRHRLASAQPCHRSPRGYPWRTGVPVETVAAVGRSLGDPGRPIFPQMGRPNPSITRQLAVGKTYGFRSGARWSSMWLCPPATPS
jgi:hypothetical protein